MYLVLYYYIYIFISHWLLYSFYIILCAKTRRELIHHLACGPKSHSELVSLVSKRISNCEQFDTILNEVSIYIERDKKK